MDYTEILFPMDHLVKTKSGKYTDKTIFILMIIISIGLFLFWTGYFIRTSIISNDNIFIPWRNNKKENDSFYIIGQSEIGRIASVYFPYYSVVYTNGIAYDLFSIGEVGQLNPSSQWLTFPLPNENNSVVAWMATQYSNKTYPVIESPATKSGLAYIDQIYVLSDPSLSDRIENLKHMFNRHNIPIDSIEWWRLGKWNRTTCNDKQNQQEVERILNLKAQTIIGDTNKRYCAITVQHVEAWRDLALTNSTIALFLEDDAIFVPFFKEKFNRFIYTAIRTGALKINSNQCASPRQNISTNQWINQDPAFVIGSCGHIRDSSFPLNNPNAKPRLTLHKERFSRCSHAYILTSCSAKEMIRLIDNNKIRFHILDWLQTHLAHISLTLQPFWLDPPLAYQGSQAKDLDGIKTFGRSMP